MRVSLLLFAALIVGACAWETKHGLQVNKNFHLRARKQMEGDIGLVLQSDINRMDAVKRHARMWDGPISLAVLVFGEGDVQKARAQLASFDAASSSHVSVHLVLSNENPADAFYPINKMRNVALENADTTWTYVMDIDETTVSNMMSHKAALNKATAKASPASTIFVVPSFEWAGTDHGPIPHSKRELKDQFNDKVLIKHPYYIKGYLGKFDVGRWMDSDEIRTIPYADKYEPYFIAQGNNLAFEDSFVGFGNNKAQLIFRLAAEGYKFVAVPDVFNFADESFDDYKSQNEGRDKDQSMAVAYDFWYRIGHAHGCDQCEPLSCAQQCPDMFNRNSNKAVLVQADISTDPNQHSVDLEKGAVQQPQPQPDAQLAAPAESANVASSTQGAERVAPPAPVAQQPDNAKEPAVQGALTPSV